MPVKKLISIRLLNYKFQKLVCTAFGLSCGVLPGAILLVDISILLHLSDSCMCIWTSAITFHKIKSIDHRAANLYHYV